MNNNLPPKQIDELVEVIDLNKDGADQFIVNVFNDVVGYKLTKKVRLDTLAKHIIENYAVDQLSSEFHLSQLAHESLESMLLKLVTYSPEHAGAQISDSLALSTYVDLGLGELATLNLSALQLDRFTEKNFATGSINAGKGEFITGITQNQGKIVDITTGNFADAVPIDASIDGASDHAIQNSVVKKELDKKLNIADTSAYFAPVEGTYVAGLTQSDGKITTLHTYALPKQQIDSALNNNSANPVENKVVKAALDKLESSLSSVVDSKFVKLADANAYYKAETGNFINAVRQTNGRIVAIESGNYDKKFAELEAKIVALQKKYLSDIEALRQQISNNYVKLQANYTQTITGPVKFNSKITGKITNADMADAAKWS